MRYIVVNRKNDWIGVTKNGSTYYFHATVKRILFFLRHPQNGKDFNLEIHHS